MSTALELVFQHRNLVSKCDSGRGLNVDEIDALNAIESFFHGNSGAGGDPWSCRRRFVREPVHLRARLRSPTMNHNVWIVDIGPGGMVCRAAPYFDEGTTLEVIVDDRELRLSYRFKAVVMWARDDGDDRNSIGLELVGTPLLVHYGPPSDDGKTTTEFERVAA